MRQLIEEGRRLYAAGERTRALQCWEHALGIDPTSEDARQLLSRARHGKAARDDTGSHAQPSSFDPESTGPVSREDLDWAEILGERGRASTDEPPPLPTHFEGSEPLFVDMDSTIAMPGRVDEVTVWGVEEGQISAHESAELEALEVPDEDPLKMPLEAFAEPELGEPSHLEEPSWRFIDTSPVPPAELSVTDLTNPSMHPDSTVDVFDDTFSVADDIGPLITQIGEDWDPEDDDSLVDAQPSVIGQKPKESNQLPVGLEALVRSGIAEIEEAEAGLLATPGPGSDDVDIQGPDELMIEAIRRRQADDFTGSIEIIEQVLELNPQHAQALRYLEENTARLLSMHRSRLGNMDRVPRIRLRQQEIVWQSLDHREGFILSQVDGETSYDEIITISGMSELDATRILSLLVERGVIG